jgi:hypothetical protein
MEISEAIRIIKAAADGLNPFTGEVFSTDSVYQHPEMVRALYRALSAMEIQARREKRKRNLPENAGRPWTDEDEQQLLKDFDAGVEIRDLARQFKRTYGSIEARLEMHGKIEPTQRDKNKSDFA